MRLVWRTDTGVAARKGSPKKNKKVMIYAMLYAIAALSLTVVGYLGFDFYNEQLKARMVPVRAARKSRGHSGHHRQTR